MSSLGRQIMRTALSELKAAGITPTIHSGGKHKILSWEVNGIIRKQPVPGSPSDCRSAKNHRAAIRRLLREDGLL